MEAHSPQIRSIEELTLSRKDKAIVLRFTRVSGGKPCRDVIHMKFTGDGDSEWIFTALHHLAAVDSITGRQFSDQLRAAKVCDKSPEQLFEAFRNLKLVTAQLGPSCEDDDAKREALRHDPYFEYKSLSGKIKRPYLPVRADARWALVGMSTLEKPQQERDYELVVYRLGDPKPLSIRVIDETGKVQPSGRPAPSSPNKTSAATAAIPESAHERKNESADIPAPRPEATSPQPPRNDQRSPTHSKRSRLSRLLLASAGVAVMVVVGAIAMKSRVLAPGVADVRVTLKIEFESVHVVRLAIGAAQLASRKPALGDAGIFYFACRMDANRDFHVTSAELSNWLSASLPSPVDIPYVTRPAQGSALEYTPPVYLYDSEGDLQRMSALIVEHAALRREAPDLVFQHYVKEWWAQELRGAKPGLPVRFARADVDEYQHRLQRWKAGEEDPLPK